MNKVIAKIPRKGLVLALTLVGLALLGSSRPAGVHATTCEEAYYQYAMADWAYDTARISWFYNSPTTCQEDCAGKQGQEFTQCVAECRTNRQTALADASVNLGAKSLATCEPATVDECDQARSMFDGCVATYDYLSYAADSDERWAVYEQFAACREASKIDHCQ